MHKLRSYFVREDGATAVEYGIMVALIAVVIIGAVYAIGNSLGESFGEVEACLEAPEGCPGDDGDGS